MTDKNTPEVSEKTARKARPRSAEKIKDDTIQADAEVPVNPVVEAMRRKRRVTADTKVERKAEPSPRKRSKAGKSSPPPSGGSGQDELLARCAGYDLNDLGNGKRLLAWHGEDLLYVSSGPGWHVWCGTHWQADPGDLAVKARALTIVDKIKAEADHLAYSAAQLSTIEAAEKLRKKPAAEVSAADRRTINEADDAIGALGGAQHKRRQFAIMSGNLARTESMVKQASAMKNVSPDALDKNLFLLNAKNGTLAFSREVDPECPDENTVRYIGQVSLQPHNRDNLITRCAEVEFDESATCPQFQAFLDLVQPSREMQRFLQVAHGYAGLIGGNGEQRLIYHYGRGANGKSAFVETIGRLLGSYRAVTSPDSLVGSNQRDGSKANSDVARLFNARLVTVEELPRGTPLKENLIKQLTGGTPMVARFLNRDFFEFNPTFTAIMTGNDMPVIAGTDHGIWRRMLIVPWKVEVPEQTRKPFGELLASFDQERAGILNWLVEGARLWLGSGLGPFIAEEVRNFTDKHREDRDPLGNFIDAFVVKEPGSKVQAKTLHDAFATYCEQNGITPWHQATLGAALKELGFEKQSKRHVYYIGIRLVDPPLPDPLAPTYW